VLFAAYIIAAVDDDQRARMTVATPLPPPSRRPGVPPHRSADRQRHGRKKPAKTQRAIVARRPRRRKKRRGFASFLLGPVSHAASRTTDKAGLREYIGNARAQFCGVDTYDARRANKIPRRTAETRTCAYMCRASGEIANTRTNRCPLLKIFSARLGRTYALRVHVINDINKGSIKIRPAQIKRHNTALL
jgi:hypothetical protein